MGGRDDASSHSRVPQQLNESAESAEMNDLPQIAESILGGVDQPL